MVSDRPRVADCPRDEHSLRVGNCPGGCDCPRDADNPIYGECPVPRDCDTPKICLATFNHVAWHQIMLLLSLLFC